MVNYSIAIAAWGLGSFVLVELVRDLYHLVCHIWPPLYRLHGWHHRVFRRNFTPVSHKIYRQAQWRHDLPEGLTMLGFGLLLWVVAHFWAPEFQWFTLPGCVYPSGCLVGTIGRRMAFEWAHKFTDFTHLPGPFMAPPSHFFVNSPYHWRHHFENQDAYFCGSLTFLDRLMGTALSLKGKTIAVTGASGTLGRSLLCHLHQAGAKPIALTSSDRTITLNIKGEEIPIKTITWQTGQESELASLFEKVDILVVNHGLNVHGERTPLAIEKSYEINAFSAWRLLELFLTTVRTNKDIATKEVWVNSSEAESNPNFSPLYQLSKRTLGDLVTLRRLDSPCVIRKLILGPFKSNLNPIGVMSGNWVAKQIVKQATRDTRNIIVTINPLTFFTFPIKEFLVSIYFKLFSRKATEITEIPSTPENTNVEVTS